MEVLGRICKGFKEQLAFIYPHKLIEKNIPENGDCRKNLSILLIFTRQLGILVCKCINQGVKVKEF